MSKDDMPIIMYKILRYLYESLKKGEDPEPEYYSFDSPYIAVTEPYWLAIMEELKDKGYIKGFETTTSMDGTRIVTQDEPQITIDGVDFLMNNTIMKKALKWLKDMKSAIPGA